MMSRKRPGCTPGRIIFVLLLIWIFFPGLEPGTLAAPTEGLFVSQIAINPQDSKNLFVLTTYAIGVMKTTDGGKTWTQVNQGIRSYSLYQLTVHPKDPRIIYLGAGGAGLYKSTDGGTTWIGMNDGLQNTDIGTLVLHPNDPETVYIVTSTGLFKSPDGGKSWIALNQGDDFTSSQQYQSLIVLPTTPPTFYLASKKGLYTRKEDDAGWVSVGAPFDGRRISALAYNPKTGRLYATVFSGETLETLRDGGLFVSDDRGKHWARLGEGLNRDWIRGILFDPGSPKTLYLYTTGRGILKSTDGGHTWKEINVGLTDPDLDIRDLVMDPHNPAVLYAGSHGRWVFQSRDAGATWKPLPIGPHQTTDEIFASLTREDERVQKTSNINRPEVFVKCNRCHGWTDPNINVHKGTWRVVPNPREWAITVKRMSKGASLTPAEEVQISDFLNRYTHEKR
jgi:photosystem II stability/assembly factor-like uncharacterized protein